MRILVTGLGDFWGAQLAAELENRDDVEMIVGVDDTEPPLPLERTEFVKSDADFSILHRIVEATQVDTVVHTHLIVDSTKASGRKLHDTNVIATMNLLAAAGAAGSPVRRMVVKSSTMVYGATYRDPYFFREETPRKRAPRTPVERTLVDVDGYVRDFAEDNPHITTTLFRFANVLGEDLETPLTRALRLPVVPEILGFDPRLQFVHENDVISALVFATTDDVPGVFNVAGDGTLTWSEVCAMVGKRRVPLPPVLPGVALSGLKRMRVLDLPPEILDLLRYGRGVDNRRFQEAGFRYGYTSAGAVEAFAELVRLRDTVGSSRPTYRYQRDLEDFFRHSPAVVRRG
ncbi:MAG: NAD-dependent epimerase/dehydratase family protein [Acidimicrobiia bacterium]